MDKTIRKMRRYVNPDQKTYFDKLVINGVILNLISINKGEIS
jgi:hypothetical protein